MDQIGIQPTSRSSATVTDIVLREKDRVRLVFRPELVDNPHEATACVRGTFIYQRHGGSEWEDLRGEALSKLKKGEGYKLELKAGETLKLLRDLGALIRFHRKQDQPVERVQLLKLEERVAQLLELGEEQLRVILSANPTASLDTLAKVLRWAIATGSLQHFASIDAERLPSIAAALGVASLREALAFWQSHSQEDDEELWQEGLSQRAFLLAQLYSYPIVIVRGKAYVGGKQLDNQHGNIADFLARVRTTSAPLIVEIKTPRTAILSREYRQDVYPPSRDLSGAVSQVLHYKASLQSDVNAIAQPDLLLRNVEPRCLVILGNTREELGTGTKKRSFELYRDRLHGVTVIGFDELFLKAADLVSLLETKGTA